VTLQPGWPEIYSGEAITLTCAVRDAGDAEWDYRWEILSSHGPPKQSGAVITPSHGGDFWCRGWLRYEMSSSKWSDAFTLKVSPGELLFYIAEFKHEYVLLYVRLVNIFKDSILIFM